MISLEKRRFGKEHKKEGRGTSPLAEGESSLAAAWGSIPPHRLSFKGEICQEVDKGIFFFDMVVFILF